MSHQCPAPHCDVDVPRSQYACPRHWYALPKEIRTEIWAAYKEEPLGERHTEAMERADNFLDRKYGVAS